MVLLVCWCLVKCFRLGRKKHDLDDTQALGVQDDAAIVTRVEPSEAGCLSSQSIVHRKVGYEARICTTSINQSIKADSQAPQTYGGSLNRPRFELRRTANGTELLGPWC